MFWFRSITFAYVSAWRIGSSRSKGNVLKNEMVWYTLIQITLLTAIFLTFGITGIIAFIGASITGWIMLETVQYIEHYGLARQKVNEHRYEDVNPKHSWNSNHQIGRAILFELSRHSDHHYLPHKDYGADHHDYSPQLPTVIRYDVDKPNPSLVLLFSAQTDFLITALLKITALIVYSQHEYSKTHLKYDQSLA